MITFGAEGSVFRTTRTYADGKARDKNGRFGSDSVQQGMHSDGAFVSYVFELPFNKEYKFHFVFQIAKDQFGISFQANKELKPYRIDKTIAQLSKSPNEYDSEILESLNNVLQPLNCALDDIIVKEITFEGPGFGAALGAGTHAVGAKAGAQLGALAITLETPLGEITAKLKQGLSVGMMLGSVGSKNKRPGSLQEKTVGFGMWEVSFAPKDVKEQDAPQNQPEGEPSRSGLPDTSPDIPVPLTPPSAIADSSAHASSNDRLRNVRKKAREFVAEVENKKGDSAVGSENLTDEEKNALSDATVKQLVDAFKDDASVASLYEEYQKSSNRLKASIVFQKKLAEHIKTQQKIEQLMTAGVETSLFLSELAVLTHNKGLRALATGLSATVNGLAGLAKLSNAIGLMSSSGLAIASAGAFFGGAGLVLGAFSAISSLFGGESEELAEALREIYSAIKEMHEEMRAEFAQVHKNFELTWKALDVIEQNNHARYLNIMEAMRYISGQIEEGNQNLVQHIESLKSHLTSYLDHLVDENVKITLAEISTMSTQDFSNLDIIKPRLATLYTWLTSTAALSARTGKIEVIHGKLADSSKVIHDKLSIAISQERVEKDDIQVGLLLSLATQIDKKDFSAFEQKGTINPKNWAFVFDVYYFLLQHCSEGILLQGDSVANAYLLHIDLIAEVLNNTISFVDQTVNSQKLWKQLVDTYQEKFNSLQAKLEEKIEISGSNGKAVHISLLKDAKENLDVLATEPHRNEVAKHITNKDSWKGLTGEKGQDCVEISDKYPSILANEVPFTLDKDRLDKMCSNTNVAQALGDLTSDIRYAIGSHYGLVEPSVIWCRRAIPVRHFDKGGIAAIVQPTTERKGSYRDEDIYTMDVALSIKIDGHSYPFAQINFFPQAPNHLPDKVYKTHYCWEPHTLGDSSYYQYIDYDRRWFPCNRDPDHSRVILKSEYVSKNDSRDSGLSLLPDLIDKKVLVPARKERLAAADDFNKLMFDLNITYLQLVAFIQLIDPNFSPNSEAILKVQTRINLLMQTGSKEDYLSLYDVVKGNSIWQEFLTYMEKGSATTFSVEDLRTYLKDKISKNLWLQELRERTNDIKELRDSLDPEKNKLFNEKRIREKARELHVRQQNQYYAISLASDAVMALNKLNHTAQLGLSSALQQLTPKEDDVKGIRTYFPEFFEFDYDEPVESNRENVGETNYPSYAGDEKLRKLCADPNTSLVEIEQLLEDLNPRQWDPFNKIMNEGEMKDRPLYLAIQAQRPDLVRVLLEYDAKVDENIAVELLNKIEDSNKRYQIKALIDFYLEMQSNTLETLQVGMTLRLLSEATANLEQYITIGQQGNKLNDAIMWIGETRVGKGTLSNTLLGVEYKLAESDDGQRYLELEKDIPGQKFVTSHKLGSDTAYPGILPWNRVQLVDMPGFEDNRGVPWDIVMGFSADLLSTVFTSMKALVLVCDGNNFFNANVKTIHRSFEMLGHMLNRDPELSKNVVLVLNKVSNKTITQAKNRLEHFISQTSLPFSDTAKAVIEKLKSTDNIILVDVPSAAFVEEFSMMINKMESREFERFNFSSFNPKTEAFKELVSRLKVYHEKILNSLRQKSNLLARKQILPVLHEINKFLKNTIKPLDAVLPAEFQTAREVINNIHNLQQEQANSLSAMLQDVLNYINKLYPSAEEPQHSVYGDLMEEIVIEQYISQIVNRFYENIKSLRISYHQQCMDNNASPVNCGSKAEEFLHSESMGYYTYAKPNPSWLGVAAGEVRFVPLQNADNVLQEPDVAYENHSAPSYGRNSLYEIVKSWFDWVASPSVLTQELEVRLPDDAPLEYDVVQDPYPSLHPNTGEPIFRWVAYHQGKECGSLEMYKHSYFCTSGDKTRHNVFSATGIFSDFAEKIEKIVPKKLVKKCDAVPPTVWELSVDAAKTSAGYGVLQGSSQVVTTYCKYRGHDDLSSKIVGRLSFYLCLYIYHLSKCLERSPQDNLPNDASPMSEAMSEAAMLTGQWFIIEHLLIGITLLVQLIGISLVMKGFDKSGHTFKQAAKAVSPCLYAYQAYQKGVLPTLASVASGVIVQKTTEIIGNKLLKRAFPAANSGTYSNSRGAPAPQQFSLRKFGGQ